MKFVKVSQTVLKALVDQGHLISKEDADALLVYSRKHYQRVIGELKDSYLLDYVIDRME